MTTSACCCPVDRPKLPADEAGVPDYMAELQHLPKCCWSSAIARTFNDHARHRNCSRGTLDSRARELVIMQLVGSPTVTTNG